MLVVRRLQYRRSAVLTERLLSMPESRRHRYTRDLLVNKYTNVSRKGQLQLVSTDVASREVDRSRQDPEPDCSPKLTTRPVHLPRGGKLGHLS